MNPGLIFSLLALLFFSQQTVLAASFQAATTSPLSSYSPRSAAFGVFSSNGYLDLALAITDGSDNKVRILHGDGAGGFTAATDLSAAAAPSSLLAADLNSDGNTDLAVSNTADGTVSVFIGTGTRTFAERVDYPVGTAPAKLALGDFDGDGMRNDLAVINSTVNSIAILINNGSGAMTVLDSSGWPATADAPAGLAAGDFNGDGIDDIAVGSASSGAVRIIPGDKGVGAFLAGTDIVIGTAAADVAATDFNNDGLADLAVVDSGAATVSIIKGDSSSFTAVTFNVYNPPDAAATPVAVSAGDFDRDGVADLAVANNSRDTVSFFRGRGDATFYGPEIFATGTAPTAIFSGDLDGNGADLLTLSSTNNSYSLLFNSSPAAAGITVTPASHDFSNFRLGHIMYTSMVLTVTNTGSAPLTVGSMTLSGTNGGDFVVAPQYGSCGVTNPTIAVGGSCTVQVRFVPASVGLKTATLNIASNAAVTPVMPVSLAGTAVLSATPYAVTVSFIGRGSGTMSFSSGDSDCTASCSRNPSLRSVTLIPAPDQGMYFYGWSGCDSISIGLCQLDLVSDKRVSADFGLLPRRIKLATSWPIYMTKIAEAYAAAVDGDAIEIGGEFVAEDLVMNRATTISLKGGYDSTFTSQVTMTTLRSLTVANGSVTIDNIVLR